MARSPLIWRNASTTTGGRGAPAESFLFFVPFVVQILISKAPARGAGVRHGTRSRYQIDPKLTESNIFLDIISQNGQNRACIPERKIQLPWPRRNRAAPRRAIIDRTRRGCAFSLQENFKGRIPPYACFRLLLTGGSALPCRRP